MNVLVNGVAGFIGSNLCMRLLEELSDTLVVGLDNLNAYYDVNIKRWRLEQLTEFRERFIFIKGSIADKSLVDKIFDEYQPQIVVNLAAQAVLGFKGYLSGHPAVVAQSPKTPAGTSPILLSLNFFSPKIPLVKKNIFLL